MKGENYWNLDIVDSKDQHSHLGQAYVIQAAERVRLLVAIIVTSNPRAGTRPPASPSLGHQD